MRKILISILCIFIGFSNVAIGENILTTQSFVDSAVTQKQDKIPANNGTTQILMNTGTDGSVGTKNIDDSTASYGGQSDALIDAATMNAAVQNAIDTEFVCISWVNDDPNDECLLVDIRGAAPKRSPNLFDISRIVSWTQLTNNGDGSITVTPVQDNSAIASGKQLSQLAPGIIPGKIYTLSFDTTGTSKLTLLYCYGHTSDNTRWPKNAPMLITENLLDCTMFFYGSYPDLTPQTISNIQIEEGNVATPYQPYGNIYMPSGN